MPEVKYIVSLKDLMLANIRKLRGETDKLDKSVDRVQSSLNGLNKVAGALGVGVGLAGVVNFGASVIESLKNYEYFSASVRTLMKGDRLAASALNQQLVDLARTSPFSLVDTQDGAKQLLAYGFAAGEVTTNLRMLGDVASALKIPFSDIAYLYGTLKTQGRAYTRDIMQHQQRGIPVVKELAKQFNVSEDAIMKMTEQGKIGFADVERAFKTMTSEGGMFFDMMNQQSKTVGGQLSNLGDNWEQLKVQIGQSQTGIISETVSWMNNMVSIMTKGFRDANIQQENFTKYGAEQFSFWATALHNTLEVVTGYNYGLKTVLDAKQYQDALYKNYVETPKKTLREAYQAKAELNNLIANQFAAYKNGEIDETERKRMQATTRGALDKVQGQINLLLTKPSIDKSTQTNAVAATNIAANTKPDAPKYTQISVTFDNVVNNLNMQNNTQTDLQKVADRVVELMTEGINDVQRMPIN